MNPFAYLGRASSPEMAGVGSSDPENKDCGGKILLQIFVHIAVMLELAPLVCWHVWILVNHSSA